VYIFKRKLNINCSINDVSGRIQITVISYIYRTVQSIRLGIFKCKFIIFIPVIAYFTPYGKLYLCTGVHTAISIDNGVLESPYILTYISIVGCFQNHLI